MKILVTGAAGFIGAAVSARLAAEGEDVYGLDSINDYYDPRLKLSRLANNGFEADTAAQWGRECRSLTHPALRFVRQRLEDAPALEALMEREQFDAVINLAAQAGVRYSIDHPQSYMESNLQGFLNVLEGCRHHGVRHLVYASSSSVYGLNGKVPFSEHDAIAHPVSLYAATKKANELMAHTYAHLYGLPTTGLRFFTVYGPGGRPDMSPFLFMDAILHDRPIRVYNNGDMWRDFTYIDDIVEGVVRILRLAPQPDPEWDATRPDPASSTAPYRIYNIGNQHPTRLMDYIATIEQATGREARKEFLPMQPGDVYQTYADSSALARATGFRPQTSLADGIARTVAWFRSYYQLD
jgi:UDP-glucuronate 4-epimerase